MPTNNPGTFTISLDFELFWGVRDVRSLSAYRANLIGVHDAVPAILDAFQSHGIHATWATVGFLFFNSLEELRAALPTELPRYDDSKLSPYAELPLLAPRAEDNPCHFAPGLIARIAKTPHQEIGTHTFSHYYCLESGQTIDSFRADLNAAKAIAKRHGLPFNSLVFPRNQFNGTYLKICREAGIRCYRGNPESWVYEPRDEGGESAWRRAVRLLDAYFNLTGYWHSVPRAAAGNAPLNIPASRFMRPYSRRGKHLEWLKLRRIKAEMTAAARAGAGAVYHLWWHPHNFGVHTNENLRSLEVILKHYQDLRAAYGMESLNMGEIAARWERSA